MKGKLTSRQLCAQAGLPMTTLKYYCAQELIPGVTRTNSGRLRFTQVSVAWVDTIQFLRSCGASLSDIRAYQAQWQQNQDIPILASSWLEKLAKQLRHQRRDLDRKLETLTTNIARQKSRRHAYMDSRSRVPGCLDLELS